MQNIVLFGQSRENLPQIVNEFIGACDGMSFKINLGKSSIGSMERKRGEVYKNLKGCECL